VTTNIRFGAFGRCLLVGALLLRWSAAQTDQSILTGSWIVAADIYGTPGYLRMELKQEGQNLTGTFAGDKAEGSVTGNSLHLSSAGNDGSSSEVNATLSGDTLSGVTVATDAADRTHPMKYSFTAARVPARKSGPPQRHEFTPTVFYRAFSATTTPVLSVAPGDTIHTTTVDAGGADSQGVRRSRGGNPQTGPFYVETAMPGDTLVVHLVRLRLNRDYAVSDDGFVESALDSDLAVRMKGTGKSIRWHLDLAKGMASPENPPEHLKTYTVPLRPMLGCVATAPAPAQAAPGSGDSGGWGGNMDFNEVVEGATLYLPVANPGALLYLGDGHAAQGDGELNGDALETSMDVEFTVDVIPGTRLRERRVETPTHIVTMGLDGSLEYAFRSATSNMARWLADDYKLTPSEIGQVIGSAAEYKVSEVADRNSGIVLKIPKERLRTLVAAPK
jgi:amidase